SQTRKVANDIETRAAVSTAWAGLQLWRRTAPCASTDQKLEESRAKIKKEPNQEPMLSDFEPHPATLSEETAGQSPSGDSQPQPWLP
ncbi:MAG: hypothetical protein WBH47_04300, partial [Streptosporangiaceae bacterium]